MPEELAIIKEESELVVLAPVEAEFVIDEPPTIELLEVIERGPAGVSGQSDNDAALMLAFLGV